MTPPLPMADSIQDALEHVPARAVLTVVGASLAVIAGWIDARWPLDPVMGADGWRVAIGAAAGVTLVWAAWPCRWAARTSFVLVTGIAAARVSASLLLTAPPAWVAAAGWTIILVLWWRTWPMLVVESLTRRRPTTGR